MTHEEILKEYGITRTENGHKVDEEVLFITHASLLNQFRELKATIQDAKYNIGKLESHIQVIRVTLKHTDETLANAEIATNHEYMAWH